MNGTIKLPKLTPEQAAAVEVAYRVEKKTVDQISRELGLPYTAVYFYAVHGGKRAEVDKPEPVSPCWCGQRHYAKGLCSRHYWQMRRRTRQARRLQAEVA